MPFKVYLLNALFVFLGLAICFLLRRRWIFLSLFLGSVICLCGIFLPCFPLFGTPFCQGDLHQKWIALTFDDGPNEPYTSQILLILEKYKVHATFFILGQNAAQLPNTVQQILADGHALGNHTMDHAPLVFKSRDEILKEIEEWEKVLGPLPLEGGGLGSRAPLYRGGWKLFRAPHGWKSPFLSSALREKGYRLIGWTRGVWDTDIPGVDVLFDRITRHPKNGMILLLHDGAATMLGGDRSQTVAVLPSVIETYQKSGYRFVTIPEMLKQ